MKRKILMTHHLPQRPFDVLEQDFELIWPEGLSFSREEMLAYLPACEGVVSVYNQPFDAGLMSAAPRLKLIANFGAGTDNLDVAAATDLGIVVANTPDTVTEATAELTMGLIVSVARRISEFDRSLRNKEIDRWGVLDNLGVTLYGKTLGILGMGSIGRAVARRAVSFGMRVVYHNRRRLEASEEEACQAQYTDRENLLRHSDFVSLNVPLNSQTRGLIGAPELELMKTSAFLVNTSRGSVVQQQALIEALKKREIAGAALDVFENEPHVPDELLGMTNVVVLPHVGGATHEARLMMSREVAGIIGDFFAGRHNFPVINPTVWQLPQLRIQK